MQKKNRKKIFLKETTPLKVEVVIETPVSYFARTVNVFMKKIIPL